MATSSSPIISNSPQLPPSTPPTRTRFTYGRRREPLQDPTASSDPDTSLRSNAYDTSAEDSVPPSSEPADSSMNVDTFEDEEDTSEKHSYSWLERLKAVDQADDSEDEESGAILASLEGDASKSRHNPKKPISTRVVHSPTVTTQPNSPTSPNKDTLDHVGGSVATVQATSPQSPQRSPSPPPQQRRKARLLRIQDSDEESESSQKRATLSSPLRRLDSTLADESTDEDMPRKPTMPRKSAPPPRNVPPLEFDDDLKDLNPSGTRTTNRKSLGTSKTKTKVKPPTKKEIAETRRERARLAADQEVSITRESYPRNISTFLASLAGTSTSNAHAATSSDPIDENWSSPVRAPVPKPRTIQADESIILPATSPPPASQTYEAPAAATDLPQDILLELGASSDDHELEMGMAEIAQESQKEKQRRDLQKLKAKLAADAKGKGRQVYSDDDDDDLLVVDGADHPNAMKLVLDQESELRSTRRMRHQHKSPHSRLQQGKQPNWLGGFAASPLKNKKPPKPTRKKGLQELWSKTQAQIGELEHERKQEWIDKGGAVEEQQDAESLAFAEVKKAYALRGLDQQSAKPGDGQEEDDHADADESDEDWEPDAESGASDEERGLPTVDKATADAETPHSTESDEEADGKENIKPSKGKKRRAVVDSDGEEGDENAIPVGRQVLARNPSFGGPIDQDTSSLPFSPRSPRNTRRSVSLTDDLGTDDGPDKENSAALVHDQSEDKENKTTDTRRSGPSSFLQGLGSLSSSPARVLNFGSQESSSGLERRRAPFGEVKAGRDLFDSPSFRETSTPLLNDRRDAASPEDTLVENGSMQMLPPAPRFRDSDDEMFSQLPDDDTFGDENSGPGSGSNAGKGGLWEMPGTQKGGGLLSKLRRRNDDVLLTQLPASLDPGGRLEPALQLSPGKLRQAADIFEKEQEYLVEEAAHKNKPQKQLYVNDDGFLTQTRPEGPNVEVYVPPESQDYSTVRPYSKYDIASQRNPLGTLSFTSTQEPSSPTSEENQPLRRLQRGRPGRRDSFSSNDSREPSPSPKKAQPRNAFDALAAGAFRKHDREKKQKVKLARSEYVEAEAEESDEETRFAIGFGKKRDGNDEEDDDDDDDKIVEGLVDDQKMNAETEAVEKVMEKVREHQEEDDARDERIARDAVEGKLRKKRRQGGIGFDDSDEDDDEDERGDRLRRKIAKKRRIGEDLDKFGENEKTRAFFQAYQKTYEDDDNDFAYLMVEDDANAPIQQSAFGGDDDEESDEEEGRVVSSRDLQDQILRAVKEGKLEQETMNPHDTSWIDQDDLGDIDMEVRAISHPAPRRRGDAEASGGLFGSDRERVQGKSWLKSVNQSMRGGTGRSGLMSAVTGHGKKAKSGGGSLRASTSSKSSTAAPSISAGPARAKPAKAPSVLSGLQRRGFD